MSSQSQLMEDIVRDELKTNRSNELRTIGNNITEMLCATIEAYNSQLNKGETRYKQITTLANEPAIVAMIICDVKRTVRITANPESATDNELAMLCIYDENTHIYRGLTKDMVLELANQVVPFFNAKLEDSLIAHLRVNSPLVTITRDIDLVPVKNGVFNRRTRKMIDYDSTQHIFLSRLNIDLDPNAVDVMLEENFKASDIINSLAPNEKIANMIWTAMYAALCTNTRWNRMIWMFGPTANNGKSMFANLIKAIIGEGQVAELDFKAYDAESNKYGLDQVPGKSLLLTDDTNPGDFNKTPSRLKTLTGPGCTRIERKFKDSISYDFRGLIIMLMNDMPGMKVDQGIKRRLYPIPMLICFTGRENRAIVDDYIYREEVHRFIVKHCFFDMPYINSLEIDQQQEKIVNGIMLQNDIILQFIQDGILTEFIMGNHDLLETLRSSSYEDKEGIYSNLADSSPIDGGLAYDVFVNWCKDNGNMNSAKMSLRQFLERFELTINNEDTGLILEHYDTNRRARPYRVKGAHIGLANKIAAYFNYGTKEGAKAFLRYAYFELGHCEMNTDKKSTVLITITEEAAKAYIDARRNDNKLYEQPNPTSSSNCSSSPE